VRNRSKPTKTEHNQSKQPRKNKKRNNYLVNWRVVSW
jgi:methionine-rich copper-binding protein CopC